MWRILEYFSHESFHVVLVKDLVFKSRLGGLSSFTSEEDISFYRNVCKSIQFKKCVKFYDFFFFSIKTKFKTNSFQRKMDYALREDACRLRDLIPRYQWLFNTASNTTLVQHPDWGITNVIIKYKLIVAKWICKYNFWSHSSLTAPSQKNNSSHKVTPRKICITSILKIFSPVRFLFHLSKTYLLPCKLSMKSVASDS